MNNILKNYLRVMRMITIVEQIYLKKKTKMTNSFMITKLKKNQQDNLIIFNIPINNNNNSIQISNSSQDKIQTVEINPINNLEIRGNSNKINKLRQKII